MSIFSVPAMPADPPSTYVVGYKKEETAAIKKVAPTPARLDVERERLLDLQRAAETERGDLQTERAILTCLHEECRQAAAMARQAAATNREAEP